MVLENVKEMWTEAPRTGKVLCVFECLCFLCVCLSVCVWFVRACLSIRVCVCMCVRAVRMYFFVCAFFVRTYVSASLPLYLSRCLRESVSRVFVSRVSLYICLYATSQYV